MTQAYLLSQTLHIRRYRALFIETFCAYEDFARVYIAYIIYDVHSYIMFCNFMYCVLTRYFRQTVYCVYCARIYVE